MESHANSKANSGTSSSYSIAVATTLPLRDAITFSHSELDREKTCVLIVSADNAFSIFGTIPEMYAFVGEVLGQLFKWAIKNQRVEWLADESVVTTSEVLGAATGKDNGTSGGQSG